MGHFHGILLLCLAPLAYGLDELSNDFENSLKKLKDQVEVYNNGTEIIGELDISKFYLNIVCLGNYTGKNVSEGCFNQMEVLCGDAETLVLMADAWSKLPYPGMLTATRQDWGAYDQCINIDVQPEQRVRVLGKHCTNGLAFPTNLSLQEFYLLSYCVPDQCTALDLAKLIQFDPLPIELISQLVNEQICSTKETNATLDVPSIVVATIFCFIFGLVVLSTAYEVVLLKRQIKNKIRLLTAFSAFANGRKLIQSTRGTGGDQIMSFHGIKVISMMWIVAGHAAGGFSVLVVTNREKMANLEYQRYAQYIVSARLAVDTFFFISGFLLAYQYFKSTANKPVMVQVKMIPKLIIHRYLRITPVVLMFFLYSMYISKHIGNGPLFTRLVSQMNGPCKENWWAVFLYIQNYHNPTNLCWTHLWYLSADWQLFLIAPLVLIPMAWQFRRRFNMVMIALVILNIFFLLLPLYTKLMFPDFDPDNLEYETHSKLITYFMGVMFGFYLRCQRNKPYIFRKNLNLFMWFISLLTLFACTTLFHEIYSNQKSHVIKALGQVSIKPFWCLGLMFIIYSCTYGYGGIVNWLLTAEWMQIISKLTYCMYITHLIVIAIWVGTKRTREYFTDFNLFFYWCGHFIVSLIVSTIWTLMFESPLITVERILLGRGKPPRAYNTNKPQHQEHITVIHKPPVENGQI